MLQTCNLRFLEENLSYKLLVFVFIASEILHKKLHCVQSRFPFAGSARGCISIVDWFLFFFIAGSQFLGSPVAKRSPSPHPDCASFVF